MIKTLILPVGPPGSGKSTLTNGLQQFMTAISRPCSVANLDPANDVVPYVPAFDVRELVSVEEVMEREELGPNGGVLWAMEEIEANLEWLEERLAECEDTVVLDPPGQPELTIHHLALPRILQRLEKMGYRVRIEPNSQKERRKRKRTERGWEGSPKKKKKKFENLPCPKSPLSPILCPGQSTNKPSRSSSSNS